MTSTANTVWQVPHAAHSCRIGPTPATNELRRGNPARRCERRHAWDPTHPRRCPAWFDPRRGRLRNCRQHDGRVHKRGCVEARRRHVAACWSVAPTGAATVFRRCDVQSREERVVHSSSRGQSCPDFRLTHDALGHPSAVTRSLYDCAADGRRTTTTIAARGRCG